MLAAHPVIKRQLLIELSISKGGAALSNEIKIPFLRRAATPLVEVAIHLYKRAATPSEKIKIPFSRGAAAPLGRIAVPLYKRDGHSLT